MSTDIVEAARDVLEEQLDSLKINEKPIEKEDVSANLDEKPTKSPKKSRFVRNDEERRLQWEELQKSKEVMETAVSGTVKWYSILGHYGFIARDDGQGDIFVHQSAISKSKTEKYFLRTLADDEHVVFDVVKGKKGLEAANVTGPEGSDVRGSRAYRIQLRHPFHKKAVAKSEEAAEAKRGKKSDKSSDGEVKSATDGEVKAKRRNRRHRQPKESGETGTTDDKLPSEAGESTTVDGTEAPQESEPEYTVEADAPPCNSAGDAAVNAEVVST